MYVELQSRQYICLPGHRKRKPYLGRCDEADGRSDASRGFATNNKSSWQMPQGIKDPPSVACEALADVGCDGPGLPLLFRFLPISRVRLETGGAGKTG